MLALLYGFPVWWALGLHAFIWPILAIPMVLYLLRKRRVRVPRGAGLILLFFLWVLLSALQLDDIRQTLAFGYRLSLYASAVILLLFIVNLRKSELSTSSLAQAAGFLWIVTAVGGFAGLALPGANFSSPVEILLPQSIASDPFIYSLVHPELSSESTLLGYTIARPKAPFNYTNEWGSNFALMLPLAVYSIIMVKKVWWRLTVVALMVPSVVPVIISINRGLWISLGVGTVYVAARAAGRGRLKLLAGVLLALAAVVVGIAVSPLGQVVTDRAERSNLQGRAYLYEASARAALDSPILGHGAPIPSDDPSLTADASIGTHGQLWTVLVSQGIPGLALLLGFLVLTLLITFHVSRSALWVHSVIVIIIVQLPFYNILPVQLHVAMIAIALCWRDIWETAERRRRGRDSVSKGPTVVGTVDSAPGVLGRRSLHRPLS